MYKFHVAIYSTYLTIYLKFPISQWKEGGGEPGSEQKYEFYFILVKTISRETAQPLLDERNEIFRTIKLIYEYDYKYTETLLTNKIKTILNVSQLYTFKWADWVKLILCSQRD